jgi:transposase
MSHSFSADLRLRVLNVISEGLLTRRAARRFGIGVSTAGGWYRRYREHGETEARTKGQPPGSKIDAHEAFILD